MFSIRKSKRQPCFLWQKVNTCRNYDFIVFFCTEVCVLNMISRDMCVRMSVDVHLMVHWGQKSANLCKRIEGQGKKNIEFLPKDMECIFVRLKIKNSLISTLFWGFLRLTEIHPIFTQEDLCNALFSRVPLKITHRIANIIHVSILPFHTISDITPDSNTCTYILSLIWSHTWAIL